MSQLQKRFEAIANKTDDMSDRLMVRIFISGLMDDIKKHVLSDGPKNFEEAVSLANIH